MSSYKSVTIRNIEVDYKSDLEKHYPSFSIDDVINYLPNKDVLVGLTGLNKEVPLLQDLTNRKGFITLLNSLSDKSRVLIDVKEKAIYVNGKKENLSNELVDELNESITVFSNYGGYLNDKGEHVIDLKSEIVAPHYAVNLLLGDRSKLSEPLLTTPKGVVDAFGGGSFRGPAANQVLATRWDMDPSENGNPFNRQFYLVEDNKQIFYSHNVHENVKEATCIHKVNRSEITYITEDDLLIKRTIYLRRQKKEEEPIALERQVVEITNLSNTDRNLSIIFTGMFGSANPGCQMVDVIYQSVINQTNVIYKDGKIKAISPDYYPEYAKEYVRFVSLGEDDIDSFSYDVSNFVGNGSIDHPEHLTNLGNVLKAKGPSFFAIEKKFSVEAKKSVTLISSTGLVDNKHDLCDSIDLVIKDEHKKELKEIEDSFNKYASYLQVNTGDKNFDNYVNHNLPFQVMYQTYVSRAFAQTQKGYREIGFREIQDIYASMYYFVHNGQKNLVKSLLSKWISNVYMMGYANHNFFFVGKEPGMCSDDQIWLVDAIYRYLTLTNDYDFLNKKFPVAGSKKKRTLLDTLKAIIIYSGKISVGKHDIPLLDKADWNDCLKIDDDCLDGPTKEKLYKAQLKKSGKPYGSKFESELSESVMNGFLLVIALNEMIEITHKIGDEFEKECISIRDNLVKSLKENAYVDGYYARVLINRSGSKYKYVGTPNDGLSIVKDFNGSLYLNSLSWSILSGVASESEMKSMLALADKYLKTRAGYKLCTPHDLKLCGSKEAATEQYFLGDRENGGVFKHATMMFVVALLKASKRVKDEELKNKMMEDASYMLDIVYPYNVLKNPYRYKGNPRFCTQYVNSITEEHIGPILSGTSTWLLLAILEKIK